MKFEVINSSNKTVMYTEYISCIPQDIQLESMNKSGYKFKLNNKVISIKKLKEFLKENRNN